jgi:hypothetical protein
MRKTKTPHEQGSHMRRKTGVGHRSALALMPSTHSRDPWRRAFAATENGAIRFQAFMVCRHVLGRQARIRRAAAAAIDTPLGWPRRHTSPEIPAAVRPCLRDDLEGEAVLTLGPPLLAWRHGEIDGLVSAGPHACMPNKIAESQFFHLAEREGLPSLTLALNGEPSDPEVLDNFAFEVHARFRRRRTAPRHQGTGSGLAVGVDMCAGNRNTLPSRVAK